MWSWSLNAVSMAKLTKFIDAPSVDLALSSQKSDEATSSDLEVCEI